MSNPQLGPNRYKLGAVLFPRTDLPIGSHYPPLRWFPHGAVVVNEHTMALVSVDGKFRWQGSEAIRGYVTSYCASPDLLALAMALENKVGH